MSHSTNPTRNRSDVPDAAGTNDTETEDKLARPHAHFESPSEVVVDPLLTKDQKGRALDALEQDAKQLATAAAEGMSGGESTGLDAVLTAKESLEAEALPSEANLIGPKTQQPD